jgi:FkbM family methyltransferase
MGDVCYDIGGFRGFMGGVCARSGAGLVVVFEPFPSNCAQIRRMANLNPTLPIRLEAIAVGDRDGEVEFWVMPEDSMGKLVESPFQRAAVPAASITVSIRRLDSLVGQAVLPPPNVIKLDVEGAELLVLRGALLLLREHRPRVLIEAHSPDLARDCITLLESVGYRISALREPVDPISGNHPEVCHLLAQPMGAETCPTPVAGYNA